MLPEVSGKISMESVHAIPSNILFSFVFTLKFPSITDLLLITSCSMAWSILVLYWITQGRHFESLLVLGQKLSIDIRCVLCKDRNAINMICKSL